MTLSSLFKLLNSIDGFENRVAYRMFPENEGVGLPFITYLVTGTDNFMADGIVYKQIQYIDIELYTENKDTETEQLVESALDKAGIPWNKDEDYLRDERCYMIVYSIQI